MKIENAKGLLEALNGDARNAMHSILGFLELVSEGALDAGQREYIDACSAAASRHFRGIEDMGIILGLGPKERSVITNFAPGNLFSRVADAVDGIAGQKNIALLLDIDSSVPPVVAADLDRIGHALFRMSEALVSALGVGERHADGSDVYLNLRAQPLPDATDLTFEAVAPATMLAPVLMRALQHDDFEFEASLSGSGALGLVAARNLATSLGGRVEASADAQTGTRIAFTFRVAVPLVSLALPQPETEDAPGAGHLSETELAEEVQPVLRILVAEDSEDSFQLFKAYLRGQPHAVERAANGEEAVELAATGAFDLVFMDICMPLMDGYAATKRIRELETGKDRARMPIVVLSAEDLRAQRRQGALVGCSGHLSKPLRKNELLEAIRAYSILPSSAHLC
jgi:CheY-like chemotaxis protein